MTDSGQGSKRKALTAPDAIAPNAKKVKATLPLGLVLFVPDRDLSQTRISVFERKLSSVGGTLISQLPQTDLHVFLVVSELTTLTHVLKFLKSTHDELAARANLQFVRSEFISQCLMKQSRVDAAPWKVDLLNAAPPSRSASAGAASLSSGAAPVSVPESKSAPSTPPRAPARSSSSPSSFLYFQHSPQPPLLRHPLTPDRNEIVVRSGPPPRSSHESQLPPPPPSEALLSFAASQRRSSSAHALPPRHLGPALSASAAAAALAVAAAQPDVLLVPGARSPEQAARERRQFAPMLGAHQFSDSKYLPAGTTMPDNKWVDRGKKHLACQMLSSSVVNLNEHLTKDLERLEEIFTAMGDKWRQYAYRKAVGILKRHPKKVQSEADIAEIAKIPGMGGKFLTKIRELLATGHLQRRQALEGTTMVKAIEELSGIHGVGGKTAQQWFALGVTRVADVKAAAEKKIIKLSRTQRVGLHFYHDKLLRIPRDEVKALTDIVEQEAAKLWPGIVAVCCGSYRRGKPTSGDCDVLITHPQTNTSREDGVFRRSFLIKLLERLRNFMYVPPTEGAGAVVAATAREKLEEQHKQAVTFDPAASVKWEGVEVAAPQCFLTGDLLGQLDISRHGHVTYMGFCKLPVGHPRYSGVNRRLDIKIMPAQHFAFSLLYFTGSDHFNRSMRFYAKKKGWTLSDHGFKPAKRCHGHKIWKGNSVFCRSEEDIFKAMKLKYIPPTQRNCYEHFELENHELDALKLEEERQRQALASLGSGIHGPSLAALLAAPGPDARGFTFFDDDGDDLAAMPKLERADLVPFEQREPMMLKADAAWPQYAGAGAAAGEGAGAGSSGSGARSSAPDATIKRSSSGSVSSASATPTAAAAAAAAAAPASASPLPARKREPAASPGDCKRSPIAPPRQAASPSAGMQLVLDDDEPMTDAAAVSASASAPALAAAPAAAASKEEKADGRTPLTAFDLTLEDSDEEADLREGHGFSAGKLRQRQQRRRGSPDAAGAAVAAAAAGDDGKAESQDSHGVDEPGDEGDEGDDEADGPDLDDVDVAVDIDLTQSDDPWAPLPSFKDDAGAGSDDSQEVVLISKFERKASAGSGSAASASAGAAAASAGATLAMRQPPRPLWKNDEAFFPSDDDDEPTQTSASAAVAVSAAAAHDSDDDCIVVDAHIVKR